MLLMLFLRQLTYYCHLLGWHTHVNVTKSIHLLSIPFILCRVKRDPGTYPREFGSQGRVYPEWGANPSQGTIEYPFAHYREFGNAGQPTAQSSDWGKKLEYPEAPGEHVNGAYTEQWDSNCQPWRCKAKWSPQLKNIVL